MKLHRFTKNSIKVDKKELNIWIDGYEANVPQRVGSSQVAFELLKNLEKIDAKNIYTIVLPNQPLGDLPQARPNWSYTVLKPAKFWTLFRLPIALYQAKPKPDLIFSPTHYVPRFTKVKRIVTIFDLSFLHFPQMFLKGDLYKLTRWTRYSALNANHIFTISNFSKQDIIKNYQIKSNKITASYPGYDKTVYHITSDHKKIGQTRSKYKINSPYLIYVGTIQPRKNLAKLIEAFSQVIKNEGEDFKQLKLVIVGKTLGPGRKGWMYEAILNKPKDLGIEDRVIFTGFVPTEELPYLISGAIALTWPSLYEGFGLPLLESMACGTPVITSKVSSLPEVVGEAGLLVDPHSQEQIVQAISIIVTDKKLRDTLSKAGLERVKKFSWTKMAKDLVKVFESVGKK